MGTGKYIGAAVAVALIGLTAMVRMCGNAGGLEKRVADEKPKNVVCTMTYCTEVDDGGQEMREYAPDRYLKE
ncbi:TPA: hypothetical protein HA265_07615 [Candidatus Woesearchaeota archaeon]|nr:hypothetical protein [Candidatus Woesearchaeota archaeon]